MQKIVRNVFGLHLGEGMQALQFARLAILWAFGNTCLDTLSDGLFLEKVGADFFPRVYFCIALAMIAISALVLHSLKRVSAYRILMISLGIGAAICVSAAFLMGTNPSEWFWYALKIASKMFFMVMIPISWTFTDEYHDLQDAKRVYAIYNAAYYIGAIVSGLAINFLLDTLGFSALLVAASLSMLLAMREARRIALHAKAIHDDSTEGVFSASRSSLMATLKLLIKSRFVLFLLLMGLGTQLILTVTEFNYMESFGSAFKGAEGEVTEFLGKCRAFISFFNILIGMFFYNRFVRRTGLNNAILVTPLFFLAVYSVWVFSKGLPLAILGLVAIEGILYTFDDNNMNLMTNAVPTKLKSKVRILIGSFFEPVGMLISSCLLFSFHAESRWLGLGLAVLVCVLALAVRAVYSSAILSNLKENALHFDRKLKTWISLMSKKEQKGFRKTVFKALRSNDEDMQILGAKTLLEIGNLSDLKEIFLATKHFGTVAKIRLMQLLDKSPFGQYLHVTQVIDEWTSEPPSKELAKHASFYLEKRGPHQRPLDTMLKSSGIDEISMALELLSGEDTVEKALPFLGHESLLVKKATARAMSLHAGPKLHRHASRLIEELENSRDPSLRLFLLETLGKLSDTSTIKDLLLASVYFRPAERRKVEEIVSQMGTNISPLLLSLTQDIALPDGARILAGKILAKLRLTQLRSILPDILDIEIDRAYFYFYFANTIQKQYPLYDLSMLQSALLAGYQSVIDFIIHLLGAAGSLEDSGILVRALHSRNEKIRANAVESLERTCDAKTFRLIAPLVDDLPIEEKMEACLKWHGDLPKLTLLELLDKLDKSPLLFDKVVATRLKTKLQTPNRKERV